MNLININNYLSYKYIIFYIEFWIIHFLTVKFQKQLFITKLPKHLVVQCLVYIIGMLIVNMKFHMNVCQLQIFSLL